MVGSRSKNAASTNGDTGVTRALPTRAATSCSDSSYITRCVSIPRSTQKERPAKSVITAQAGTVMRPDRRSAPNTAVVAG